MLIPGSTYAQECGIEKINEAKKMYNMGLFFEINEYLQPCLEKKIRSIEKIEAYRLIALSYLAIDSLEASREASKKILEIKSNFETDPLEDPPGFIRLIQGLKNSINVITSVSKKEENPREAPASVIVITEQEIMNRGYNDIEQIFHDLPGFDITKGRGPNYSNLYQRGYRSVLTDRTILLIDGVEQNDLSSDNAPISGQYPLSNIKRIEVIYGPASTMYGANAFLGVVNIVTKTNNELVEKASNEVDEMQVGVNVNSGFGSLNTQYLDGVIAVQNKNFSFSVTGRYYRSDDMDLTSYDSWNFNHDEVDYFERMNISGTDESGAYNAENYINNSRLDTLPANDLYQVTYNTSGIATEINLTNAGESNARSLDADGLTKYPIGVDPSAEDWYLKARMQLNNFTLAIETWKSDEGSAPWYTDNVLHFRNNFSRWINWNSSFYINYEKRLSDELFITNLTSYRLHTINGGTNFERFRGYYPSSYSFHELAREVNPVLSTTYYYRTSNQLRNETRVLWSPSEKWDIISGVEFRSSLIQGDYLKSAEFFPDETGSITAQGILGTDHFRSFDIGVYTQITRAFGNNIRTILGGRVDHNRIRTHGGYGTVFNPRLAIVYNPGAFIFKTIYATAFKDASYLQKYGTAPGRDIPNPTLEPEKVQNIEVSAFWSGIENLSVDAAFFNSWYSDVVGIAEIILEDGTKTGQFQPIGKQQIYGLQSNAKYTFKNYSFWANYTYTMPTDKESDLRISDIASHRFNAGINALYLKQLNINLRTNYVGQRLSGLGTSGSQNQYTSFDPYILFHLTAGYKELIKGLNVQLSVQNIFDKAYFDPGVRTGIDPYASKIPQYGRTFMIKLAYNY